MIPVNVSSEEFFEYFCEDKEAINQFNKFYVQTVNDSKELSDSARYDYEDRIAGLKEERSDLEDTVNELQVRLDCMDDYIKELKEEIEQLHRELRDIRNPYPSYF